MTGSASFRAYKDNLRNISMYMYHVPEDHCDEDRDQLEDLVQRMEHAGTQVVVQVHQVFFGVVEVNTPDISADLLHTEIAKQEACIVLQFNFSSGNLMSA